MNVKEYQASLLVPSERLHFRFHIFEPQTLTLYPFFWCQNKEHYFSCFMCDIRDYKIYTVLFVLAKNVSIMVKYCQSSSKPFSELGDTVRPVINMHFTFKAIRKNHFICIPLIVTTYQCLLLERQN